VLPLLPPGPIWECAVGDGRLAQAIAAAGRQVFTTDLFPQDGSESHDFRRAAALELSVDYLDRRRAKAAALPEPGTVHAGQGQAITADRKSQKSLNTGSWKSMSQTPQLQSNVFGIDEAKIPGPMKAKRAWVNWHYEQRESPVAKPTKVPIRPNGLWASTNRPGDLVHVRRSNQSEREV
jgi:hypothetical protein